MVFAFGHAVDGALGLGPLHGLGHQTIVAEPRLLTYFFDQLITIQSIACGGDLVVGSHSAAVDTDGSVYTWGTGVALGNRSVRSHSEPQRIDIPRLQSDFALENEASAPRIRSVACGGGFCVALAESGHAFAWGKWSDGRLGLGSVPILNQTSRKYGRRRQFQSLQLSPKQLGGRDRFAKVACGEAHCVALTHTGALETWGRGAHGQLGLGSTKDALSPTLVTIADRELKWRDVAAGENWSMALDALGRVWTWGACGGPVLGTGAAARAAVVTETILQHHYRVRKQPRTGATAPAPALPQLRWMRPQLVPSFGAHGVQIERLSAGRQHAAALSSTGDLYVWGDGDGFASLPQLVHTSVVSDGDRSVSAAIGSEIVEYVVCGGDAVIAFTSGSFLARSMRALYEQCMQLAADHQQLEPSTVRDTIATLGIDVALLVAGKRLFAHKLVLAKRSAVLRDLIVTEQRTPSARLPGEALVLELLLPQLRHDVATVLLEYMYTDNASRMLDPQSYLVRDVLRAARMLELHPLEQLCRSLVDTSLMAVVHPLNPFATPLPTSHAKDSSLEEPRSLTADLALALGDATWSDLSVIAEGRAIPAHRCVLTARSAYFRALLAFDARVSDSQTQTHVREVRVDESYACALRVLTFIYGDRVTRTQQDATGMDKQSRDDAATDELLEDLIAADKFGLVRFKRLCEHAVYVTPTNCLDVLAVADLVHAAHLKQVRPCPLRTRTRTH